MSISTPPITENIIRCDSLGLAYERGSRVPNLLIVQYETNQHASKLVLWGKDHTGKTCKYSGLRLGSDSIRVFVFFGSGIVYTSTYKSAKAADECEVLAGILDEYTLAIKKEVA